jgi:hyperosmotically inducible protein
MIDGGPPSINMPLYRQLQQGDKMDHISDLALDPGIFALDNELESGRKRPPRMRRDTMPLTYNFLSKVVTVMALAFTLGCSQTPGLSPDVKEAVEKALVQANFTNIKVAQDREKGVITLSGDVRMDADKQTAENVARNASNSLVIANEIGVRPAGFEIEAKLVDASLDTAIEKNFEAILIGKQLNDIKYTAKNGVLTLTGEVNDPTKIHDLGTLAGTVANVKQVVNELQVKPVKATSSPRKN